MSRPHNIPLSDDDASDTIIELDSTGAPQKPKRRRWWKVLVVLVFVFLLTKVSGIYVESLWFSSLGFGSVYWTGFKYEIALFAIFGLATFALLAGAFAILARTFDVSGMAARTVLINNQPVPIRPGRVLKPVAWIVAALVSLATGAAMSGDWQKFAVWVNRTSAGQTDSIFGRDAGFFLFSLPVYETVASWFVTVSVIILIGSVIYSFLTLASTGNNIWETASAKKGRAGTDSRALVYKTLSFSAGLLLVALAIRVYISRYEYLFEDHSIFTGVSFTEHHYILPAMLAVAVCLLLTALILIFNAFTRRSLRLVIAGIALPVLAFVVGLVLIPGYVQSFMVKPNELDREAPYIERNIAATKHAYNLENIEGRDFPANGADSDYALEANRPTLDNLRIWDYQALRDTLRQVQEIRTYYDFNDVDVDRYKIGGQTKQMMVAARELDVSKLPESSRGNWINERLIYTHGYGITMNSANGFTPEGRPEFIVSNMPAESNSADITLTRPQIYFGEKTNTTVYVDTKQKEFDYPQGEANASTTFEANAGILVGNTFRRWVLAWELDDISRLPFSDDVTSQSRVLMRRNLKERVQAIAPFLRYDADPYIVVTQDGKLVWMLDAYTVSDQYPYARHHDFEGEEVNYIRNSVKVTIDAYDGSVNFYVFDDKDPVLGAYRRLFPALFRDRSAMPADLQAHVRYPEAFIKLQADAYGLYHTDNAKVFFQREDLWTLARESAPKDSTSQPNALEPYFALLQLPGHNGAPASQNLEFVNVVAFTPASRDNMISWMAGRSDGDAYGSLLVYRFPKSKLVNGPLQVNARIEQNAQLSSQLTLWNQQGSRVQRGSVLIIPLGTGLLYVEPVYLKSERSPMPELRLVVLATQDRIAYGTNFQEALGNLFGKSEAAAAAPAKSPEQQNAGQGQQQQQQTTPTTAPAADLIKQAAQDLADYQRLTSEGKLGEAGQKLESLKKHLDELQKGGK